MPVMLAVHAFGRGGRVYQAIIPRITPTMQAVRRLKASHNHSTIADAPLSGKEITAVELGWLTRQIHWITKQINQRQKDQNTQSASLPPEPRSNVFSPCLFFELSSLDMQQNNKIS